MTEYSQQDRIDTKHFKTVVQDYTLDGACGRKFIQIAALKRWLTEGDRISDLLHESYRDWPESSPALPVESQHIRYDDFPLIFSILLDIGHGSLIHHFCGRDLRLPLDKCDILEIYERVLGDESPPINVRDCKAEDLVELFYRRQWAFCPPLLQHWHTGTYSVDHVLPIRKGDKSLVNTKGRTASVWQVVILEEFLGDDLRRVLSRSRFQHESDGLGYRYQLALKSFDHDKKLFYETEVKAFRVLKNNTGMVKFLGHFDRQTRDGNGSYHIMLEYGQFDLDEYFYTKDIFPPRLPAGCESFWGGMLKVAEAIRDLHLFAGRHQQGNSSQYHGCYADIRPEKILWVNGFFKLTNSRFMTFKKVACKDEPDYSVQLAARQKDDLMMDDRRATCEAPECNFGREQRSSVTRSIDIWSLGCVFSIVATWVILGPEAVQRYHKLRQDAIWSLVEIQKRHQDSRRPIQESGESSTTIDPDCFHDGQQVLHIVTAWHDLLRKAVNGTDLVTPEVLKLIDERMLLAEARERISASDLCVQMNDILKVAHTKGDGIISKRLLAALADIDVKASTLSI